MLDSDSNHSGLHQSPQHHMVVSSNACEKRVGTCSSQRNALLFQHRRLTRTWFVASISGMDGSDDSVVFRRLLMSGHFLFPGESTSSPPPLHHTPFFSVMWVSLFYCCIMVCSCWSVAQAQE